MTPASFDRQFKVTSQGNLRLLIDPFTIKSPSSVINYGGGFVDMDDNSTGYVVVDSVTLVASVTPNVDDSTKVYLCIAQSSQGIARIFRQFDNAPFLNSGGDMGCCDQVAEILSILQGSGAGVPVFFGTFPPGDQTSVYQGQVLVRGSLPMTFSVVSGSLPDGTSLNTSTGLITGNPIGGNYTFTLKAENSFGSTTQEFSIAIVGIAPLFTFEDLIYGAVNNPDCTTDLVTAVPYSSIAPIGENVGSYTGTPPITWTIEQGIAIDPSANFVYGVPDGLSIDPSTGQLSGFPNNDAQIPNTGFGNYGVFSIRVRGTNAWGTYMYPPLDFVAEIAIYVYPSGTPIPPS